jgi:hypothetical protein
VLSAVRPQRFDLQLPVWYRTTGDSTWHVGVTGSISTTGALIHPQESSIPSEPVIIAISLPVADGCLVGRGRVVRRFESTDPASPPAFAVSVDSYRIEHRDIVFAGATD